jgi:hypothetical protein
MSDPNEHLRAYFSGAVSETFNFWTRGLVAFVLISSIPWFVSGNRSQRVSIGEIAGYLFPRKLYGDATARISHWNYVLMLFLWGPHC